MLRHRLVWCLVILGVPVLAGAAGSTARAAAGPNLVVNGSFDAGTTGFTTGYTPSTSLGPPASLDVASNPQTLNGAWPSAGDHTSGHGPMLVVNGSTTPDRPVWSENLTVAPDTTYSFSVWVMSLFAVPAQIRLAIDGTTVTTAPAPRRIGTWAQVTGRWTSGASGRASLSIVDDNPAFGGNDFALDDVSFKTSGAPGATPAPGNPRVSTIARSIASPSKALSSGRRTLENLAIAALLVLFITFPAQLFNHTFDENYAEIREFWKRRLGPLERLRRLLTEDDADGSPKLAPGDTPESAGGRLRQATAAALVVLVGGLLGGLLDPHFGLDRPSLLTFAAVVGSTVFGIALSGAVGYAYRKERSLEASLHLRALPAGLLIAVACVVVSRVADFEPGYLYGLVCAIAFSGTLGKREEGHTVSLAVAATVGVAIAAWGALVPLGRLASHPHEAWPLVIGADLAATLFTGGIVGSMIGSIPLTFLPGGKIAAWHRGAWALVFGSVTFLFCELILRPGKGGHPGNGSPATVVVLFAVFGAGSVAFYWYFARKEKAGETGETVEEPAAPATPEPDPS